MEIIKEYLIQNYKLSCSEILQSILISPYGMRHLEEARLHPEKKWGHRVIACIQFIPILGQIAMCVEWIASRSLRTPPPMKEQLFRGSQGNCNGSADPVRVLRIVALLQALRDRGIGFNRSKVTGSVDLGTCTAMALDFADSFFRLREVHQMGSTEFSPKLINAIRSLGNQFAQASPEMRIRQAAFNTIEVVEAGNDPGRSKIQSLVNFHNMRVDSCSQEFTIDQSTPVVPTKNGLYLLRAIEPSNNEKLEESGHSMIYVKNRDEALFYDPNFGVTYTRGKNHFEEIGKSLTFCRIHFQHTQARFYQLVQA